MKSCVGPFQSRDNYASAADVKFVIVMHRYMYDLQDMHVGWSVVPASFRRRAFGITQTMAFEFHEQSSLDVSVLDVDMPLLTEQEETLKGCVVGKSATLERAPDLGCCRTTSSTTTRSTCNLPS